MGLKYLLIIVLLVYSVLSENECFRHVFDEDFDRFTVEIEPCVDLVDNAPWTRSRYDEAFKVPKEKEECFISPSAEISCIATFPFEMKQNGKMQVNIYMDAAGSNDYMNFFAYEIANDGPNRLLGSANLTPDIIESGWRTIDFNINSLNMESFRGYMVFMGRATEHNSTIMIDSFQYVPAGMSPDSCILYEDALNTYSTKRTPLNTTTENTVTIIEPMGTTSEPTTLEIDSTTIRTPKNFPPLPESTFTTASTVTRNTFYRTNSKYHTASTQGVACLDSIWTPLTIILLALIVVIVFVLVALVFFYLGQRKAIQQFEDINYRVPRILPRVTRIIPGFNINPYMKEA